MVLKEVVRKGVNIPGCEGAKCKRELCEHRVCVCMHVVAGTIFPRKAI